MLSNKINKSEQARHFWEVYVDGVNWNSEYESGIECNL